MQKKLFKAYPHGILISLGFMALMITLIFSFVAIFKLNKPNPVMLSLPIVQIDKPSIGYSAVKTEPRYNISATTPFLAITANRSYFSRLQAYQDGLEQNSLTSQYEDLDPELVAAQTIKMHAELYPDTSAASKTLIILPAPDISMHKLKSLIKKLKQEQVFSDFILASGVI